MKGFKKLALVSAIAAAPFAQAELVSIDDSVLSEMTGQAGVTIELDTSISIGSLTYTDTDGVVVDAVDGPAGTIEMNNIAFGGAGVTDLANSFQDDRFDDVKIDIDVDGTDGIIIHLIGTDTKKALLGINPVDFGLKLGDISSNGLNNPLLSGVQIAGNLGPIDIVINNTGASSTDLINVQAYFEVTAGQLDVDVIGLGITNLKIGQDSSPLFAATSAYRGELENVTEIKGTIDAELAGLTTNTTMVADLNGLLAGSSDVAVNGTTIADIESGAFDLSASTDPAIAAQYAGTREAYVTGLIEAVVEGGVAVGTVANGDVVTAVAAAGGSITDVQVAALAKLNNTTNMAFAELSIGTASTSYYSLADNDTFTVNNALTVSIDQLNIDVSMDLTLGEDSVTGLGVSLGSIAIQDLDLGGTKLVIYGH